jgi:cysteine-rich repeat protein
MKSTLFVLGISSVVAAVHATFVGVQPPQCGDGVISVNLKDAKLSEACDDGNNISNDGCSSNCTLEVGYECRHRNTVTYKDSNNVEKKFEVELIPTECLQVPLPPNVCGDGRRNGDKNELCDDGNLVDGDGCSSGCKVESDWDCLGGSLTNSRSDKCVELVRDREVCLPDRQTNLKYKRVCYQEYGGWFDAFYGISWIAYVGELAWVCWCMKKAMAQRTAKSKGMSFQEIILLLQGIGDFFHMLWLVGIQSGFHSTYKPIGFVLENIALKVPQVMTITSYLLMILVWADVVNSSESMKKAGGAAAQAKKVYIAIGILVFLLVVLNTFSQLNIARGTVDLLNNLVFAVYGIALIIGALFYVRKLVALMSKGNMTDDKKESISKIKWTVNYTVLNGVLLIVSILLDMVAKTINADWMPTWHYIFGM